MHAVASAAPTVFVTHPDAHTAHATVDTLLYCPAAHAVQLVAPASPILLTVPAIHNKQLVFPVAP